MNIREELIDNSKEQALRIASYVGADPGRFDELMELFLNGRFREAQLSAMAVGVCVDRHPQLALPYLEAMLKTLGKPVHDAVVRCIFRIFQDVAMPEDLWGETWDICYKYLSSAVQPVAIRVYAMTTLSNICVQYPELKHELQSLIEDHMPYGSAGFQSRGRKVLKKLNAL